MCWEILYEKGLTKKRSIKLETLSGIKRLDLNVVNEKVVSVKVNMDKPIWEAKKIPVISDKEEVIDRELIINKEKYNITCISMGNPHCVVFMDNIHKLDLEKFNHTLRIMKFFQIELIQNFGNY